MSAFSDYLEGVILELALNGNNPATALDGDLFLALYTVAPTDADTGTEVPFTFGYGRAGIDSSSADKWTVTNGVAVNTAAIVFAIASGGNWGTIAAVGLRDAATSGNLLFHGDMIQPVAINNGETFQFPASTLAIRLQ